MPHPTDALGQSPGAAAALDAAYAHTLADAAREAMMADLRRRRDSSTPYGRYCERLRTAWQRPAG